MSAPIACQLLNWIRANRAWLYRLQPRSTQPDGARLRDTIDKLARFEKYYRGAQCWLRGTQPVDKAPVPPDFFSGAQRHALRLMALLTTHDLSKPPVWGSLYALPGLDQEGFSRLLSSYVGHHALPPKIMPLAESRGVHATWSMANCKGVLAVKLSRDMAHKGLTYTFVTPHALPSFGEQMQQARDYWRDIEATLDELFANDQNWPDDAQVAKAEQEVVEQLVHRWVIGLTSAQRGLLRKHSAVVTDFLTQTS